MVTRSGDPPKQLEKKDEILAEKSRLELIIQIRAFAWNERSCFLMILVWVLIKIL